MEEREKIVNIKSNFTGNNIKFSIIIPFKEYNNYLFEALTSLNEQTYKDFEIILLPDNPGNDKPKGVIEIPTGNLKPADKRDIGAKNAKGELLAFMDDDAYPNEIWLERSLEYFKDPDIAMVCGPGLTPQNDSPRQIASGKIYESFIVSGKFTYRYKLSKARFVEDFPSSNMIVRKAVFDEVGGFSTKFWPGEDTKLCLDVVYNLKKKILYSPELFCYHHRRNVFSSHLKQVYSYAIHRGFFVKKFPKTSRNFAYFVPLFFIFFFVTFPFLSIIHKMFSWIYLSVIFIYISMVFISSIKIHNLNIFGHIFLGTILTHVAYGVGFLKGLISKELKY
jgi:GT2 family glycosyltransferase